MTVLENPNSGWPRRRDAVICLIALATVVELRTMRLRSSIFDYEGNASRRQSSASTSPTNRDIDKQIHDHPSPQPSKSTNDWFEEKAWLENQFTNKCWHVEDICHSTHRWFYDPRSNVPQHQPPFSVEITLFGDSWPGRPTKMIVDAPNSSMTIGAKPVASFMNTCTYSSTPNHIVFQGYYNDMLGEFYSRTLPWLYLLQDSIAKSMKKEGENATVANATYSYTNASSTGDEPDPHIKKSFLEHTQVYLHIANSLQHNKMLDSHHLFTEAFRSQPLLSITSLLDNTGCQCLKRLILCGYEANEIGGAFTKTRALNTSISTALIGAGTSGPMDVNLSPFYNTVFRDLRRHMRQQVINTNPFVQHDVETFRRNAILRAHPSLHDSHFRDSDYKIVGLTQRSKRRRWINLNDLLNQCNKNWFAGGNSSQNVVCIEVNVENSEVHPVRQAVMHAACDMLIGIHGAQLTEGIWLKDGSTVIELLPWIPPKGYGVWTRAVKEPTPLGEIFHESELNHIGYLLGRDSAHTARTLKTKRSIGNV